MPRKYREIPWIAQHVTGQWYVHWYDQNEHRTKSYSLRTKDAGEAQNRYAAFISTGQELFMEGPETGLTVRKAIKDYTTEQIERRVVDKRRQKGALWHIEKYFGGTPIRDITLAMSERYADVRRSEDAAEGTILRELRALRAVLRHALKYRRIPYSDLPSLQYPVVAPTAELGESDWLTEEEYARVVATATGKLRDFILLAYDTGSRRNAIEVMQKSQVDLVNNRVNLTSPEENLLQRRSKKHRPIVPIGPEARPVYERLVATARTEYLFDKTDMYWAFRRLLISMGLARKARPHVLRHSRATHLLQDGVPLWAVAQLLGDSHDTVEQNYAHCSPEYLAKTLQAKKKSNRDWLD